MKDLKIKVPKKGAGKRLRDFYEKNRKESNASNTLLNGLREPIQETPKKSAIMTDLDS